MTDVIITRGYVQVSTPLKDCESTVRTIDFPYVGRLLHGSPRYHWTAAAYVKQAAIVARKALKTAASA
jgi:hypothetical protein